MTSSDSSDSDIELKKRLQESTAIELSSHMNLSDTKDSNEKKPSLRINIVEKNDINTVKVTPEFRQHVAKKLSSYLDGILDITERNHAKDTNIQTHTGSVKLLQTSSFLLQTDGDKMKPKPIKKRKVESSSDSEGEMEKLKSVLVTGNDILNGGEGNFKCCQKKDSLTKNNIKKSNDKDKLKKKRKKHLKNKIPET